jgi:hypothetical protein
MDNAEVQLTYFLSTNFGRYESNYSRGLKNRPGSLPCSSKVHSSLDTGNKSVITEMPCMLDEELRSLAASDPLSLERNATYVHILFNHISLYEYTGLAPALNEHFL